MKLKLVHYLVEHETVLPSLKDDCHPGLAQFGKDRFPNCDDNEGEKNVNKTLDSFSFDALHPIQVPIKNQSRKCSNVNPTVFF